MSDNTKTHSNEDTISAFLRIDQHQKMSLLGQGLLQLLGVPMLANQRL